MHARRKLVFLSTLVVLFANAAQLNARPPAQDESLIRLQVEAGFNSYIKETAWVPLRVSLENSGEAFDGEVVVLNTRLNESEEYVQPISIGKGAKRQLAIYVPATSNSYETLLRTGADQRVVAKASPQIRQLTAIDRLVVVASDPPDAYNFIGDIRVPYGGLTAVAQMRLSQLPEQSFALDNADALVLSNVDTESLTTNQRAAIRAWVIGGGHLLLSGGPGAQLALNGLRDIAPAQTGQRLIEASVQPLDDFILPNSLDAPVEPPTLPAPMTSLAELNDQARVLIGANETPLIARRNIGRGIVDQLAFDPTLAPLSDWEGRMQLFAALLGGRVDLASAVGQPLDLEETQNAASAIAAAAPPSPWLIAGIFGLYVLLIGPANYLVLKRLRKPILAWLTIPVAIFLFSLPGLLGGFRLQGNRPQTQRLALLMGDAQTQDMRGFGLLGIWTPRFSTVEIEATNALIDNLAAVRDAAREPSKNPTRYIDGRPSRLTNVTLNGSNARVVFARLDARSPASIKIAAQYIPPADSKSPARIYADVVNSSNLNFKNCVMMSGKDYQAIGDINAGETLKSKVELRLGHPQTAMNLRNSELLRGVFYRGRYYGITSSANPASSVPTITTADPYPFDLNGAPILNALVNWQEYDRDVLTREAQHGLVSQMLGLEYVGVGVYLGCWLPQKTIDVNVTNADNIDRSLIVWRAPVKTHLVEKMQVLPPDVFTWDVIGSTSSASFSNEGLSLEPGEHLIGLSPWFDMRMTSIEADFVFDLKFSTGSNHSDLRNASVYVYDWNKRAFAPVPIESEELSLNSADISRKPAARSGAYISPSGEMRLKIAVQDEPVTLTRVSAGVTTK
jgi:hypothetical protein